MEKKLNSFSLDPSKNEEKDVIAELKEKIRETEEYDKAKSFRNSGLFQKLLGNRDSKKKIFEKFPIEMLNKAIARINSGKQYQIEKFTYEGFEKEKETNNVRI